MHGQSAIHGTVIRLFVVVIRLLTKCRELQVDLAGGPEPMTRVKEGSRTLGGLVDQPIDGAMDTALLSDKRVTRTSHPWAIVSSFHLVSKQLSKLTGGDSPA
jgi:hypothetical protein